MLGTDTVNYQLVLCDHWHADIEILLHMSDTLGCVGSRVQRKRKLRHYATKVKPLIGLVHGHHVIYHRQRPKLHTATVLCLPRVPSRNDREKPKAKTSLERTNRSKPWRPLIKCLICAVKCKFQLSPKPQVKTQK